jgi:hypothetical protein
MKGSPLTIPVNTTTALVELTTAQNNITPEAPYLLDNSLIDYTKPIHGYISPILVLFTLVTNILVCIVLTKRHMRSPTNTMLTAMAVSDMLTGVWPVPCFIYFFAFGYYKDYVPYEWCHVYNIMTINLPTIFHTASIWLTMALAIQRYIYVCHPIKAKTWCTIPRCVKGIVLIYFVSALSHLNRFVDQMYVPITLESRIDPSRNVTACQTVFTDWVKDNQNAYFNVYFWFRVLFIHFIPCTTLVVMNALLIYAMRRARMRRILLLRQNRKSECRRLKESNCTTMMLVLVVGVFLLVELPLGIIFILFILENTFTLQLMAPKANEVGTLLINVFILLSYPINFFIYCAMSKQFRLTFKRLFIPGSVPLDREHSQYISLATENGGGKTVLTNQTVM